MGGKRGGVELALEVYIPLLYIYRLFAYARWIDLIEMRAPPAAFQLHVHSVVSRVGGMEENIRGMSRSCFPRTQKCILVAEWMVVEENCGKSLFSLAK